MILKILQTVKEKQMKNEKNEKLRHKVDHEAEV